MTSPVRAPRPTPRRAAPPDPAARRAHLRVVAPTGRQALRRRRTGAVFIVAAGLIFGSLMASAIFHGLLVSGQSNLDHMDTELQDQRSQLARERLELADLQSPARIAAEAEKMGMVPADRQHWLSPGTDAEPIVTGSTDEATTTDTTPGSTSTTPQSTSGSSSGSTGDELATADGGAAAQ
ncbi:hypothetical protein [Aquihabitans sp. McL0605]|uniref:hypothetical protein n=1 Tax=Aquihabitans sp. McL0605 TaxID=3415671 RepID=UPI003CF61802